MVLNLLNTFLATVYQVKPDSSIQVSTVLLFGNNSDSVCTCTFVASDARCYEKK